MFWGIAAPVSIISLVRRFGGAFELGACSVCSRGDARLRHYLPDNYADNNSHVLRFVDSQLYRNDQPQHNGHHIRDEHSNINAVYDAKQLSLLDRHVNADNVCFVHSVDKHNLDCYLYRAWHAEMCQDWIGYSIRRRHSRDVRQHG